MEDKHVGLIINLFCPNLNLIKNLFHLVSLLVLLTSIFNEGFNKFAYNSYMKVLVFLVYLVSQIFNTKGIYVYKHMYAHTYNFICIYTKYVFLIGYFSFSFILSKILHIFCFIFSFIYFLSCF